MAVLKSCAKHNMVAYMEKTDGNTNFHEIINFLTRSSIQYALTVSLVVSTTFVEQFWMSVKSKIINNVRYITAKVAGKPVNISEASIRSDLLFDDDDGIDSLHNQAIFDVIQLMGSKSTYWDQIPTNIATTMICLATNQKYNFSKLIFDGNVTPLFESMLVQPIEDEGEASERQSEPQPTPSPPHPSAEKHETQPDPSPRPSPTILIPDSIPYGSGGNHGATQIKDLKSQIKQLKKKAKPVISHHNAWIKSVSIKKRLARKNSLKKKLMQKESVSKQGRKLAKSKPIVHKDPAFDDLDDIVDDVMDYMETKDAQDRGRTSFVVLKEKKSAKMGVSTEDQVSTVKPDEGTNKPKVSTNKPEVSTAKPKEVEDSTDKLDEGTAKLKDGTSDESVEIKDAKDSDRPRATSTRLVLTLKPLPKIDPKDKGKKVLEEEVESNAESEGVDKAERKFDQLAKDEEIARKEERKTFTVEERAKFLYDTIAAQRRFLTQQRADAIRSRPPIRTQLRNQMMTYLKHVGEKKHDERQIKEMNEESKDPKKKRLKKRVVNETLREEDTANVPAEQEVTEQGTKKRKSGYVKMITRKRPRPQPDDDSDDEQRKCLRIVTFNSTIDSKIMETKSFVSMLHKVSSPDENYLVVYRVNGHFRAFNYLIEQYSEITPEGIELILWGDLKIMMESSIEENDQVKSWLVQDQTVSGKDILNMLIADSLLETIWLSMHHVMAMKH
ncbi:hypothetical protein Tco_0003177 [Tanacetum coccineum]